VGWGSVHHALQPSLYIAAAGQPLALPPCLCLLDRQCLHFRRVAAPLTLKMNLSGNQDWDTVVISKKRPNA
jgi:hypothetical protein